MTDLAGAAAEFAELAKNLRLVADEELSRELSRSISEATQPLPGKIRSGLGGFMPNRYAGVLSGDLSLRTSQRSTGSDPGVKIVATGRSGKRRRMRRLNDGTLAHPLFGHRKHWYNQPAKQAGWFDKPIEEDAPEIRDAILAAMARVAEKAFGR